MLFIDTDGVSCLNIASYNGCVCTGITPSGMRASVSVIDTGWAPSVILGNFDDTSWQVFTCPGNMLKIQGTSDNAVTVPETITDLLDIG